ncbi:MAG: YcgN family cysteine cluster protein [Pseudomonadota bacterium]
MIEEKKFWEKPLAELSRDEWESICDGCGRCCLKKLQDEFSDEVHYTRVVCRYMDQNTCSCKAYQRRQKLVPDCLVLDINMIPTLHWIPDTCAYKLRYDDKPLPDWHPLVTGSRDAMDEQGISVTGKTISENHVHEDGLEEHIIRWVRSAC